MYEDEMTLEEQARLARRALVRRVIVIVVVIAMIATLVLPLIVRVVRAPTEPGGIVAAHAPIPARMIQT